MARTGESSIRIQNAGVFLPGSFNIIDLLGGLSGVDGGNGIVDITGAGSGGGAAGSLTVTINLATSGIINNVNQTFTYNGLASYVIVDSQVDTSATIVFKDGVTTITTSSPPQNNFYIITGTSLIIQTPPEATDVSPTNTNRNYTFTEGQASVCFVDSKVDMDASFSYNAGASTTAVVTSTPPQQSILLVGGGGVNPQIPSGSLNQSTFFARGVVAIAVVDNDIDGAAVLTYNSGTNETEIVTSVPPQNNIYAF